MTAKEAYNKTMWNNIPGDVQDEIMRQVECGSAYAIVSENYMHELTIYSLQQLGYGIYHDRKENKYKIIWS